MHDQARHQWVGCEDCDAVYVRIALASKERAYCPYCGTELYRDLYSFNTLLALVVTSLMIFVIANSFPIVTVELQGIFSQTTLLGAAWTMYQADRAFVGFLILMTTFVVPLLYLLLMAYILSSVMIHPHQPLTVMQVRALRGLYLLRTWGMVEVFLIGILVTLVKLVGMVKVIPGIALWAFAILSLLLVYIVSMKVKDLWDAIEVNGGR
ncbi:paraquat-inducible protein A [Acinetobacter sp. 187]|uniref:paraquat-inducible protein A n=1 Tax=Acinetobacter lanii TaxID=2715163 RepID=UPI00140856E1|nr:paraquat-inducible protein A [Acinetobacter lanii]NHC02469.1 paraquat-inducible protein A [Acinetobacter lanii]